MDWENWRGHLRTTGAALKNWFIAQCYDSLAVALLWLAGLLIIGIPWAPLWAVLAGLLQFIPNFGAVVSVIPPVLIGAFSPDHMKAIYVLILFAVIMVVDGLFLQPYLMKRTAKVPFWAALLAPLVLGFIIPFWGVLLAPPLLAVVYAFRRKAVENPRAASAGPLVPGLLGGLRLGGEESLHAQQDPEHQAASTGKQLYEGEQPVRSVGADHRTETLGQNKTTADHEHGRDQQEPDSLDRRGRS